MPGIWQLQITVTPLMAKQVVAQEQKTAIRELQQSVGELVRQKNAIESDGRLLAYVIDRRLQSPRVAVLVNQLSELVPDGIYLTQLALSKGRVRLTGQGSNVVGLIDIVNGSAFMEDAKFDSTVSRNPRTGLDQFSIGARVVGARSE